MKSGTDNLAAGKTVLVVDDEDDIREILEIEFMRRGFKVLQAPNARAALAIAEKRGPNEPIDVVVSDVRMPQGDGRMLLTKLREIHFALPPVILLTGFADLDVAEAMSLGAENLLTKPFLLKDVIEAAKKTLSAPHERWTSAKPEKEPELNFDLSANKFSLGRGGFCVEAPQGLVDSAYGDGTWVSFKGPEFSGYGVIRWIGPFKGQPGDGVGVEIRYLAQECLQKMKDKLGKLDTKAFIPASI